MSYEITTPDEDKVTVHGGERKTLRFQVTNNAQRDLNTACKIICEDDVPPGWCSLAPAGDQVIAAGQASVYEVAIAVPKKVKTSSGKVTVEASWVQDPNGTFTTGPKVGLVLLPAEREPTFWEKYGKWVTVAAAALALVVLAVVLFTGGPSVPEIVDFALVTKNPVVGDPTVVRWRVAGDVAEVVLDVDGESQFVGEDERLEGSRAWPLTAGPHKLVLTAIALRDPSDENSGRLSVESDPLQFEVAAPAVTLAPAAIQSFSASPATVELGKPVEFRWTVTGDVASALLNVGQSSDQLTAEQLRGGTLTKTFTSVSGPQEATLAVLGKDGQEQAKSASFTINPAPTAPQIEQLTAQASSPVRVHLPAVGRSKPVSVPGWWSKLGLVWKVSGRFEKLEVTVGKQAPVRLKSAAGTLTLPTGSNGFAVREGDAVVLTAFYDSGKQMRSTLVIDKAGKGISMIFKAIPSAHKFAIPFEGAFKRQ